MQEILVKESSVPVLLYATKENRGWPMPKLPVLELMLSIHVQEYGISDERRPQNIDLEFTGEKLPSYLQRSLLKKIKE